MHLSKESGVAFGQPCVYNAKKGQGHAAVMKTYVKVSFLIILIFQRFDLIIQRFDGKRSKQKRKVNVSVPSVRGDLGKHKQREILQTT